MAKKSKHYIKGNFQVKSEPDKASVEIEGFANKAVRDRIGDLIPKEAWELGNFAKNPMIFFNHDRNEPIGKAIDFKATDDGLKIKVRLSRSNEGIIPKVRDLVKEGILQTFSVGFDDHNSGEKAHDGSNTFKRAELIETSIVTIPMNQDSIFSVTAGEKQGSYRVKAYEPSSWREKSYREMKADILAAQGHLVPAALIKAMDVAEDYNETLFCQDMASMGHNEVEAVLKGDNIATPEFIKDACKALELDFDDIMEIYKQEQEPNKDFQECVSAKIPKLIEEGKDRDDAIAMAISACKEKGACEIDLTKEQWSEIIELADQEVAKHNKADMEEEEGEEEDEKTAPDEEEEEDEEKSAEEVQTKHDEIGAGQPGLELQKAQISLMGSLVESNKEMLEVLRDISSKLGDPKPPEASDSEELNFAEEDDEEESEEEKTEESEEEDEEESEEEKQAIEQIKKNIEAMNALHKKLDSIVGF